MSDALNILREWVTAGKHPELKGDEICFGAEKFHAKTTTGFRSHNGEGERYELDALWFYIENKNRVSHAEYIIDCSKRGITSVEVVDQKNLEAYLQSHLTDIPNIQSVDSYGRSAPDRAAKRRKTSHGSVPIYEKSFYETLPPVKPIVISSKPNIDWNEYKSRERPSLTRETMLQSTVPLNFKKSDYSSFWKLIDKVATAAEKKKKTPHMHVDHTRESIMKARKANPVIVVPPGVSSLLTIANAKKFLGDGKYETADAVRKKAQSTNTKIENKVLLHRQSKLDPTRRATFEIINDPKKAFKTPADWDRIVAVFALGKDWQFKNWRTPWNTPSDLFTKACGFYMHYDDTPKPQKTKQWRLSYLPIAKRNRHMDHKVSREFWKVVDTFLPGHHNNSLLF